MALAGLGLGMRGVLEAPFWPGEGLAVVAIPVYRP